MEGFFPNVPMSLKIPHISTFCQLDKCNSIQLFSFLGRVRYPCMLQEFIITYLSGLNFQEKTLGPAGPQVFRFSCQQKYFSEKREKLVASEKKIAHWRSQWSQHQVLWYLLGYIFDNKLVQKTQYSFIKCSISHKLHLKGWIVSPGAHFITHNYHLKILGFLLHLDKIDSRNFQQFYTNFQEA